MLFLIGTVTIKIVDIKAVSILKLITESKFRFVQFEDKNVYIVNTLPDKL